MDKGTKALLGLQGYQVVSSRRTGEEEELGVDVARLMADSRACRAALLRLGPARIQEFEASAIPGVELVGQA